MKRFITMVLALALIAACFGTFAEDEAARLTEGMPEDIEWADVITAAPVEDDVGEAPLELGDGEADEDAAVANAEGEEIALPEIEEPVEEAGAVPNGSVAIDETNFPDANFRAYVSETCDADGDGALSDAEIVGTKEIVCSGREIASLKGIEFFTALENLNCTDNSLASLDVSGCTALHWLYCGGNSLTSLDVSGHAALKTLLCEGGSLASLNANGCTALEILRCDRNQLTSLNVNGCTAMWMLTCEMNSLTSLDVGSCAALKELWCDYNRLTSLDVSRNTRLTILYCCSNQLTSLTLGRNQALNILFIVNNRLTSLDVSGCPRLVAHVNVGYIDAQVHGGWDERREPFNVPCREYGPDHVSAEGRPVWVDPDVVMITTVPGISPFILTKNDKHTVTVDAVLQVQLKGAAAKNWVSSNKGVATVDAFGIVKALKAGTAKITAKLTNKKTRTLTLTVVDPTMPTKLTLSQTGTVPLYLQSALTLTATMGPSTAESSITWKSSNPKIAAVVTTSEANTVVIKPVRTGTVTVTATTKRGNKSAKVKVKISDATLPKGVSIVTPSEMPVWKGHTLTMQAILEPSVEGFAPYSPLAWTSSNKKVIAINKTTGELTAKKPGTAKITVTTRNKKKATLKLTVIDPSAPTSVAIDQGETATIKLSESKTLLLTATLDSEDHKPNPKVTWSTSNKKVATVSKAGLVTAKKPGTVKITVTTSNKLKKTIVIRIEN